MKNFKRWPAIGVVAAVAAVAALAGCGGGGSDSSSSNASVRLINATLTHPSLDLLVNAAVGAAGTDADKASAYVTPAAGSVTLQINDKGGTTALAALAPSLTGGNHYTVLAYESGGAVKSAILNEDFAAPAAGSATLRLFDAAAEAGTLDVYVTASACTSLTGVPTYSFTSPTTTNSVSLTQSPGTYNVCVTAQGDPTDLRMSQSITLAALQIATVVITPTVGGQLINSALLVQQGAYTAARNPNARVRLAAAVSGGTTVSATTDAGIAIDSSRSPALGFYTLVPATSKVNVTLGSGAAVTSPTTALQQGGDATLLVYGDAASPKATLLADDNRAPDTLNIKLRVINGLTGSTGALTLTANGGSRVGVNVAQGAASIYSLVRGSGASTATAITFTLSSSTSGTFPNYTNTLNTGTTYTVLVGDGGGTAAPLLLIR